MVRTTPLNKTLPDLRSSIFMIVVASALCVVAGCSKTESRKSKMEIRKLSREQEAQLVKQRTLVLSTARSRSGTREFTRTTNDLPVLQRLIDERAFDKTQTFELQALGVVFGDVLATELGLHWESVTDEYGTDPVLRLGTSQVQVAALTMISKRVEDSKQIDLVDLVKGVRETLKEMKESGDYK